MASGECRGGLRDRASPALRAFVGPREELLDLSPHQVKQAETQKKSADSTVSARLPETYQWLLVPSQSSPREPVTLKPHRLTGQDSLAERASKKLCGDDDLRTAMAGTILRHEMESVPLWRGDHVAVRQLVEDFASFPYLPRLRDPSVLIGAVRDGLTLLTWEGETFAFADSWDEAEGRYRGLRGGKDVSLTETEPRGLLVKPEVARRQMDAESVPPSPVVDPEAATTGGGEPVTSGEGGVPPGPVPPVEPPRRYHGTVELDPARVGRDAGQIADEVISHLVGLVGAKVTVTLEIEAEVPSGVPETVVRTVTENGHTLRFTNQGFEKG